MIDLCRYKVFTAAELAKSSIVVTSVDSARKAQWEVVQVPCLLVEGADSESASKSGSASRSIVFGANAICWHLLQPLMGGWEASDPATLDCLQWEERELEPMVGLSKLKRSNGKSTCLGRVLEALKEPSRASLIADVAIVSTLGALRTAAGSAGAALDLTAFPNVIRFLDRVDKSDQSAMFEAGRKAAEQALGKSPWKGPGGRLSSAPIVPGDAMQQAISQICKEAVFRAFPVVGEAFEVHVEPGKALKKNERPPELQ